MVKLKGRKVSILKNQGTNERVKKLRKYYQRAERTIAVHKLTPHSESSEVDRVLDQVGLRKPEL